MYNVLRFYFPVFIWAYNTLKLLLLEDEAALKVLDGVLTSQIGTDTEMTLSREHRPTIVDLMLVPAVT